MASHSQKLQWWGHRICGEGRIDVEFMGRSPVRIQPEMIAAVDALEAAMLDNGYQLPIDATGSYSCRKIAGTSVWSLHAVPIAIDIDYPNNPVLPHALERGFGTHPEITITEAQVNAAEAIVNADGVPIWKWLGWRSPKADPMHFEIDVPPDQCQPAIPEDDHMTQVVNTDLEIQPRSWTVIAALAAVPFARLWQAEIKVADSDLDQLTTRYVVNGRIVATEDGPDTPGREYIHRLARIHTNPGDVVALELWHDAPQPILVESAMLEETD